MTRLASVDPGLTGALVLFDVPTGTLRRVMDMPVCDGQINAYELSEMLINWGQVDRVVIETQHSMPKQGVASTFKTGMGYGVLIGVCATLGRPVQFVSASTWTKALRVGSDKERHRKLAMDTWPDFAAMFTRAKDHNRADAALLALWSATQVAKGAAA